MNYGWIVLGIITLFEGLSGFGRTSALSPFLKDLCHDLDLSYSQISGAYALANLFAGFVLPYVGQTYDRYKPANFLRIYIIIFSGSFIVMSMLKFMQFKSFVNFCIFLLGFLCVRTAVHAYSVAGRSSVAIWFDKKRGLATALSCFILSTIASLIPYVNLKLQQSYEWYQVWISVGICWGIIMLSLCSFVKKPSGINTSKIKVNTAVNKKNDFLKKPVFWLIMLALFFKAFQNTGIAFHYILMCEEFGVKPETFSICIICISVVTSIMTFVFGHFFEKLGVKILVLLFLSFDCCFLFCLKGVSSFTFMCFYVLFSGCYWALNQIVAYLAIPKLFGIDCIGKIHGYVLACVCLGNSFGPFIISLLRDISSYQSALTFCMIASFILLLSGFVIKFQPVDVQYHEKP